MIKNFKEDILHPIGYICLCCKVCTVFVSVIVFVFVSIFAFVQLQGWLPHPMATAAICQAGHFVDACHLVSNEGLLAPQVLK